METIEKLITDEWGLKDVTINQSLQNFDNRSVLKLHTSQGYFVCKITKADISHQEFAKRTSIFSFLRNKNFAHAPIIINTKSGNTFYQKDNKFIVLMEFIEGKEPAPSQNNYIQLGTILASLNNFNDFSYPALISVNAIRPYFQGLSEKLPNNIQAHYLQLAKKIPDIDALPHSLIHFEASLKNTVQKPDGTIIIIDWDEAGMASTILDPGYHLINYFVSEDLKFDINSCKAFYASYLAKHSLSNIEIEQLFNASLFHALRYIVWGDTQKRWTRILWALENRDLLLSALR